LCISLTTITRITKNISKWTIRNMLPVYHILLQYTNRNIFIGTGCYKIYFMLFFKQSIQLHLFVFFLVGVQFQLILGFNEKYTSQVMCVYSCHKTFITSCISVRMYWRREWWTGSMFRIVHLEMFSVILFIVVKLIHKYIFNLVPSFTKMWHFLTYSSFDLLSGTNKMKKNKHHTFGTYVIYLHCDYK
jgi:hypothetical protein